MWRRLFGAARRSASSTRKEASRASLTARNEARAASTRTSSSLSSSRVETPQPSSLPASQRKLSSAEPSIPILAYEALLEHMEKGDIVLIDVREAHEIAATGKVQHGQTTAENLPLPKIQAGALNMDDDDFKDEFGFDKPKPNDMVVFTCRSGARSGNAALIAKQIHAYENVFNYKGSALEWFSKER